jgi:DNA-binding beta-propeller fold protein YncE
LPDAAIGASYSYTLSASATTSGCPAVWFITGGRLPNGLTLNGATGAISGTAPNFVQTATFQISVFVPGHVTSEWVALPVTDTITVDPSGGVLTNEATDGGSVYVADGTGNAVYRLSSSNPPAVLPPPALTSLDYPESVATAAGYVFAANFYGSENVSSTTPAGNVSIPGCNTGVGLATVPSYSSLPEIAVTCALSSTVYLLTQSGSSYAVASSYSFPSGALPAGVVHVGDNLFLVGDVANDTVTLLSLPTSGTATALATVSLPTGSHPANIAYDPFNSTAYVADPGTNAVSQVRVGGSWGGGSWGGNSWSLTDEGEIAVGTAPYGIAVDPFANTLVVSNSGDNDVDVISISGKPQILYQPTVGQTPNGVAIIGGQAYIANAIGGAVTVIGVSGFAPGSFHGRFGHWQYWPPFGSADGWNPLAPPTH